jgi:hypothetical protein
MLGAVVGQHGHFRARAQHDRSFNIIAWATVLIVGGLTIVSTIALFLGSGTAAG